MHCLKCRFLFSRFPHSSKVFLTYFPRFLMEILEFPQIALCVFHCFHVFRDPVKAAKIVLHLFLVFHLFRGFVPYTFNWFIISMLSDELPSFTTLFRIHGNPGKVSVVFFHKISMEICRFSMLFQ